MKVKWQPLAFATLLATSATVMGADLLNIDFTNPGSAQFSTKTGPAAVGLSETDYWNPWGGATDIKWSDGSSSGVSVSGNLGGAWYTFAFDPMFQSYLVSTTDQTFTLANMPAGQYDFYVYAHGQPPSEAGKITLKVGGTTLGTKTTSSAADWNKPDWTEGSHYVLFRNVTVATGNEILLTSSPNGGPSVLNGLQILASSHTTFRPIVTEAPYNRTAIAGGPTQLTPKVMGTEPLSYQWNRDGQPLASGTNLVLEISPVQFPDAGVYTLTVTNEFGTTTGPGTTVTVRRPVTAPLINVDITDPSNPMFATVKTGAAAIGASNSDYWNRFDSHRGSMPLLYANGLPSGASLYFFPPRYANASFTLNRDPMFSSYEILSGGLHLLAVQGLPEGEYDVYVYAHGRMPGEIGSIELYNESTSSRSNKVTSNAPDWDLPVWTENKHYIRFASVPVQAGKELRFTPPLGTTSAVNGFQIIRVEGLIPIILTQPTGVAVNPDWPFSLTISATAGVLSYQWQKDGVDIPGAISATYSVDHAVTNRDDGGYRVKVSNLNGDAWSDSVSVAVRILPPVITGQPSGTAGSVGQTVQLSVQAAGVQLNYQWQKDGSDLVESGHFSGVNSDTLRIVGVLETDAGLYKVRVWNVSGEVVSAEAKFQDLDFTLLNVNFGHVTQTKIGPAAAGLSASDFWNQYSTPGFSGGITNLQLAGYQETPIGLTVDGAPGQWSFIPGLGDMMYDSYVYGSGNILATFYGVPAGEYDLFLFGHADLDSGNTAFTVVDGGESLGRAATTTAAAWKSLVWAEGAQYVRFSLHHTTGQIVITASPDGYDESFLNGLQLQFKGAAPSDGKPPSFGPFVSFGPTGAARLTLQGVLGATYTIYSTSDFSAWKAIGSYSMTTSAAVVIEDPDAVGAATRFYKAILVQ